MRVRSVKKVWVESWKAVLWAVRVAGVGVGWGRVVGEPGAGGREEFVRARMAVEAAESMRGICCGRALVGAWMEGGRWAHFVYVVEFLDAFGGCFGGTGGCVGHVEGLDSGGEGICR